MLIHFKDKLVAGCDEAGRGCLAGPVCAAAVILPPDYISSDIRDSKQLSGKKRELLRKSIELDSLSHAVVFVSPGEIDRFNILQASILAMHRALNQLRYSFDLILVDGTHFKPYGQFAHQCITKGDQKYLSIAAASILAKTWRDQYMAEAHLDFPQYAWKDNKGYPTRTHRNAILKYGICEYHRKSFKLLAE